LSSIFYIVGLAIAGFTFLNGAVTGSLHLGRGMSTSPIPGWARLACLLVGVILGGLAVFVLMKNFK
jgi:hypothetical protein